MNTVLTMKRYPNNWSSSSVVLLLVVVVFVLFCESSIKRRNRRSTSSSYFKYFYFNRIHTSLYHTNTNMTCFNNCKIINMSSTLLIIVHLLLVKLVSVDSTGQQSSDAALKALDGCNTCKDIFYYANKYTPQFDSNSFTTPIIRVDRTDYSNLISFKVVDKDVTQTCYPSNLTIITNDTNFYVTSDLNGRFSFNFKG